MQDGSQDRFPPGPIAAMPEGCGVAIVADLAGLRVETQGVSDAVCHVAQMTEQGGFVGVVDIRRVGHTALLNAGKEGGDMGCGCEGTLVAVNFLPMRIADSITRRAEDHGRLLAQEGDPCRVSFDGLGEATTVFPHERVAAEIVGDGLGIGRFLVVFEVIATASGRNAERAIEVESPAGEVEKVNPVETDFAGAPVPEPRPIPGQEIVPEGTIRGGALPQIILEAFGDGCELSIADAFALAREPGTGEVGGAKFAGTDAFKDFVHPRDASKLQADLKEAAGPADAFDEELAFTWVVGEWGFEVDGLARFEGEHRGRTMPVVGGGEDDSLDPAILENAAEIRGGLGSAHLKRSDPFRGGVECGLVDVAEPGDVDLAGGDELVEQFGTPRLKPHEGDRGRVGLGGACAPPAGSGNRAQGE